MGVFRPPRHASRTYAAVTPRYSTDGRVFVGFAYGPPLRRGEGGDTAQPPEIDDAPG